MPLVNMRDMLNHAHRNEYAIGGFHVLGIGFLDAILQAAENCRSPVILSLAEPHFGYYDFELAMAAAERGARRASVPVAIQFEHGTSGESAKRAISLGCNGVMVDHSNEDFSTNVSRTRQVVELAHRCGVTVEGELGCVAGVVGEDPANGAEEAEQAGDTVYTSVAEAEAYAERTGVDCLAVSVGTVHGHVRRRPKLDFERLRKIRAAVSLPLVIHGGSGLTDDQYRRLIQCGAAKINYFTALADVAADSIRGNASTDARCGYTTLVSDVRSRIRPEVERCMRLWGSAGRAAEVMMQCRPWCSVQHVVICSLDRPPDTQVEQMVGRGSEALAEIPGVRRVISGWTVREALRFRLCWLVEVAHESVISSWRERPDHAALAGKLLRPIAGDRLSVELAPVAAAPAMREPEVRQSIQ
jgi:fructose-bisphosphate aldolase class II